MTDVSSTDKPEAGRAPEQPNPNLVIDLSDAEDIARTAHAVAVASPRGRARGGDWALSSQCLFF